jgi:hypothetical protein
MKEPCRWQGFFLDLGAGLTGLEPATSGVTDRRSNQLSYSPLQRGPNIAQKFLHLYPWRMRGMLASYFANTPSI